MKQALSGIFQIAMFRFRNPSQLRGEDYSIGTHLSHLEPGCAETIDGIRLKVALLAIHRTVFVDAECMCLYTIIPKYELDLSLGRVSRIRGSERPSLFASPTY